MVPCRLSSVLLPPGQLLSSEILHTSDNAVAIAASIRSMTASVPGLQRRVVVAGLAGFWLATALVLGLLAAWPPAVMIVLGVADAAAVAVMLGIILRLRLRGSGRPRAIVSATSAAEVSPWRGHVAGPGLSSTANRPATRSHGR
jgi:hypothetical protein